MRMRVYARGTEFRSPLSDQIGPDRSDALLFDLRGLPDAVTQVVELRPADIAPGHDLDLGEDRRMHRKRAFHTHSEADLADGEGFTRATALAADDRALEQLDPLAGPLDDAYVDLERVAGRKLGDVVA